MAVPADHLCSPCRKPTLTCHSSGLGPSAKLLPPEPAQQGPNLQSREVPGVVELDVLQALAPLDALLPVGLLQGLLLGGRCGGAHRHLARPVEPQGSAPRRAIPHGRLGCRVRTPPRGVALLGAWGVAWGGQPVQLLRGSGLPGSQLVLRGPVETGDSDAGRNAAGDRPPREIVSVAIAW